MPELPEVENLRRGLERAVLGQKIKKILVHKPKLISGSGTKRIASQKKTAEFIQGLTGEKFTRIDRRAKNIIFYLSHDKTLVCHLKMSGQFAYRPHKKGAGVIGGHPIELSETTLPNKHTHVIFDLEKGSLFYNDTRMFGYLLYYPKEKSTQKENHFALYGLEPFDTKFTKEYLFENLKNKSQKIKALLMDQKIVTGLGNIYVDESLFEAKIHPNRKASSLSQKETNLLHKAIIRILKKAVDTGGSSVASYRLIDLSRGNYAREHKVYGKEGEKCPRCKTTLKKTLVQSRTTIFCPKCQK